MWLRQQNSLNLQANEVEGLFQFIYLHDRYSDRDDFEDSGGPEALPASSSSCCGASAVARSAAVKEQ